jgi:hypothetical protein
MSRFKYPVRHLRAAALVTCCLGALLQSQAEAAVTITTSGLSCQPLNGTVQNNLDGREGGVTNRSTSSRYYVLCPIDLPALSSAKVDLVTIYYKDLNYNTSNGNVRCYLFVHNSSGGPHHGNTEKWSCTTPGGCTTNSEPGFISSYGGYLAFSTPFGSLDVASYLNLAVACELPPKISTGASGIIGIRTTYY